MGRLALCIYRCSYTTRQPDRQIVGRAARTAAPVELPLTIRAIVGWNDADVVPNAVRITKTFRLKNGFDQGEMICLPYITI